jgi:TRAP-type mannitol/chloroaromatic compound transport system permease small subunit
MPEPARYSSTTVGAITGFIDGLNARIGKVAAWAIVVAIAVSTVNAVVRKIFGVSSNGWLELQWYLFGAAFMLCAPWTLKRNEHIRIDVVSSRISRRARNWIDVFGHLFFLFPFVAVVIWFSVPYVWRSLSSGEVSNNTGGLLVWPAKALMLIGFALLALQWLSELLKRFAIIGGRLDDREPAGLHQAPSDADAPHRIDEGGKPPDKA